MLVLRHISSSSPLAKIKDMLVLAKERHTVLMTSNPFFKIYIPRSFTWTVDSVHSHVCRGIELVFHKVESIIGTRIWKKSFADSTLKIFLQICLSKLSKLNFFQHLQNYFSLIPSKAKTLPVINKWIYKYSQYECLTLVTQPVRYVKMHPKSQILLCKN